MNRHNRKKLIFNTKILLLLNLCINFIIMLILVPISNNGLKYAMLLTKQSYITQENLIRFVLSPSSIIFILFLVVLIPFILMIKISSLIFYCNAEGNHRRPYLFRITSYGFFKLMYNLRSRNLLLISYTIPFYLMNLLPVVIGIIFYTDFGKAFTYSRQISIKLLIITIIIYLSVWFLQGIFTIHYGIAKDVRFRDAYQLSKMLFKKNTLKILKEFYTINISLSLAFFLLYYLLLLLTAIAAYLFSNKSLVTTVFLSAYPKINFYATLFYGMFTFAINLNLVTSLFHTFESDNMPDALISFPVYHSRVYLFKRKHRLLVNALFILILLAAALNFYLIIHNDSLYLRDALSGIQISSHRGNSHLAPENTLPAIDNAIRANSDFAEIDIQETKDGILILMHDKNLQRTAGVNEYIRDITFAEAERLDVGSWFGDEYVNTRIPSLEEVMVYCKGKIKLNIEIKSSIYASDMVEKLVGMIDQYDFIDQCVVTSTDYAALVEVKNLNENIKTGYILTKVYGNLFDKEYIDFYSIRSTFITKRIIESAHEAGKEVHAWTVNSTREIERLKSIGIDCIITDNPSKAREIIYRDTTNDTIIQLIRRMFTNRTLYTFLNY